MLAVNVINMLEGINADVLPFPGSLIFRKSTYYRLMIVFVYSLVSK